MLEKEKVKEKLREKLESGQSIGAGDIAAFSRAEPKKEEDRQPEGPIATEASEIPAKDPLMGLERDPLRNLQLPTERPPVTILPAERDSFLDALVTGGRFSLATSLFNGKVQVTFRARTQEETSAIYAEMYRALNAGELPTNADWVCRVRAMLLACQVGLMNDKEFDELAEPLRMRVKGDGSEETAGWLGQVDWWLKQPEALATGLYEALQEFESKYWTMVENAANQDFWNPPASTSE